MKLGPRDQKEMSFKEKVYGRTDGWMQERHDGQRPITIAHLEPSATLSLPLR